jgi:hypothetical protein
MTANTRALATAFVHMVVLRVSNGACRPGEC